MVRPRAHCTLVAIVLAVVIPVALANRAFATDSHGASPRPAVHGMIEQSRHITTTRGDVAPFWPQWITPLITGLVGGGGLGSLSTLLVTRKLDRRTKRDGLLRQAKFHLRELERYMSVARDFPSAMIRDYDALTTDLRALLLSSDCVALAPREYDALSDALHECQDSARYLSLQARRTRAYTSQYKTEIVVAATKALATIYEARSALNDDTPVRWPTDPKNRRLWLVGDIISRT